jgi:hypothetical protein
MMHVGSGENVLLYLSRYLFRVAISNERILAYDGARVIFKAKGTAMTIIGFRCFVIRTYGSGKLCADLKITAESAFLPPMNFTRNKAFGHFERLSASLFSVLPDRFALREIIALD